MTRTLDCFLVLAKGRYNEARVVRKAKARPRLMAGECAVRIRITVPDEAFDPVLKGPDMAFAIDNTLRAEVAK